MGYLKALQGTMTDEKKKNAKKDLFAFYVGRPISYVFTIPFLYLNWTPNMVSVLSIVEVIIAGLIISLASTLPMALLGWVLFFIWNLLDGVDGNIARLKRNGTSLGSVYDAISGYIATYLVFFCTGIFAAHNESFVSASSVIIMSSLSGVSILFPRLVMHKANSVLKQRKKRKSGNSGFGLMGTVALNLTSVAGFIQVFLLIALIFKLTTWFTMIYLLINCLIMVVSIWKLLKANRNI